MWHVDNSILTCKQQKHKSQMLINKQGDKKKKTNKTKTKNKTEQKYAYLTLYIILQ